MGKPNSVHGAKEQIPQTCKINIHTSKVYFKDRSSKFSAWMLRQGRAPKRQGLYQLYILTIIDLYNFGWLVTLIYVIFDQ